jgi:hypothetical protein
MHLRPFQRQDIPALVSMTIECDKTDALANYLVRDVDKYPTSHRRGIYQFIRSKVNGRGRDITFVLESDPEDYASSQVELCKEVVGVATWRRHGTSSKALEWQRLARGSVCDQFNCFLVSLEDWYNALFPSLNPCFSLENLRSVDPVQNEEWDREVFGECWSLEFLQVFPSWQRRGLSKILMGWGQKQAEKEAVPIVVSASPVGNLAYRSAGFKSIGFCGYDRFFDETRFGGERMQLWVWEPSPVDDSNGHCDWAERARLRRKERQNADKRCSSEVDVNCKRSQQNERAG